MNKLYKLLTIIFLSNFLRGMNFESFPFEKLPPEQRKEVLEFSVRQTLHNHIRNAKDLHQILELRKILKANTGKDNSINCKLLPKFALTNKEFLAISQSLIPKIILEEVIQEFLNNHPSLILNFCKEKELDSDITQISKLLGIFKVNLEYEYSFPHFNGIVARGGGTAYIEDISDSKIYGTLHQPLNSFLIISYCKNPDSKIIDILKFAFNHGNYVSQDHFSSLYDLAVKYHHEPVIELLDKYKEQILNKKS
jgi:hypothetical protein